MPIIEAEGLSKTYRVYQKQAGLLGALRGLLHRETKEVRAVDGVSFAIEPGEIVGFLGPNGAGTRILRSSFFIASARQSRRAEQRNAESHSHHGLADSPGDRD